MCIIVENVAGGKEVYVSGLSVGSAPSFAVDGNDRAIIGDGTCTTVAQADRPWLVIDLGQQTAVHGVTLTPAMINTRQGNFICLSHFLTLCK